MTVDLKYLKKSIGKTLKFEVDYITKDFVFTDVFYAVLKKVNDEDNIIVEELFILVKEDYKDSLEYQMRLLKKNSFRINSEIPLNG